MKLTKIIILTSFLLIQGGFTPYAKGAEKITFVHGIFTRSVTIKEIENFTEKGIKKGLLAKLIKKEEEANVKNLLVAEYKTPIVLTSKLLYSEIGNVIIKRICKVVHPLKINNISMSTLAIRSAVIQAIDKDKNTINLINFIKAYPSDVIAINITELYKVLNKVETMSDLMKFYSDSPLDKLKKGW